MTYIITNKIATDCYLQQENEKDKSYNDGDNNFENHDCNSHNNKTEGDGSIQCIIKQPLLQILGKVFQKHRYLYEPIAHLCLKSYEGQYY